MSRTKPDLVSFWGGSVVSGCFSIARGASASRAGQEGVTQKKERVLIMPSSEAVPRACLNHMEERAQLGRVLRMDSDEAGNKALPLYDDVRKCGTFPKRRRLAVTLG